MPDPLENVESLASEMALLGNYQDRYPKLLLDTYGEDIVENIDMDEIIDIMSQMTFANAKI